MTRHRLHHSAGIVVVTVALALAAGCGTATPGGADSTDRERGSPPDSQGLGNAEPRPWEAEDCGFKRVQAHASPAALIEEYLRRDAQRSEVAVDEWFGQAVLCPDHEGGPDMFALAAAYELRHLPATDSTAAAVVSTRRLGDVGFDSIGKAFLNLDTATVVDTVHAVRTPFGWRIDGPAFRLAVHPDAPLARAHLSAADRARLSRFLDP